MPSYFPKRVEPKWQRYWLERKTFRAVDGGGKPKLYILDMFPYPSAQGLHVGHPEGYTATDILCRYKRMRGFNVLHPMGWDAFGLPAEQYAVQTNTHPRVTTTKNVDNFRRQIQALGFSYDWDREVDTTDPKYYRWTQWIFLRLYNSWYDRDAKKGRPITDLPIPQEVKAAGPGAIRQYQDQHRLAYVAEAPVNWCEALGTVLANEEVINGRSERGNHPVTRLPLRQWMLRITAYAERLLEDLDSVDWPDAIKEMQRNWIGRSEGAEVDFLIARQGMAAAEVDAWRVAREKSGYPQQPEDNVIRVFTTRPDTLFGATYMVLAPEHPLVDTITTAEQAQAVTNYREQAARKSDLERSDLAKEKTGVFTGAYAINPANLEPVPVWIADYVLMGYGTGAIMAVPAHDERDFEFASKHRLDIVEVVADPAETPRILQVVYGWLGEWERRTDEEKGGAYIKAAILLNGGFDIESFEEDLRNNAADPLWAEVAWRYDPEEAKGLAIRYLSDDFADILTEYIDAEEDTEVLVFSLDPAMEDAEDAYADQADGIHPDDCGDVHCDHEHHVHEEGEEAPKAYTAAGLSISSGPLTGLMTSEAKKVMTEWLATRGLGRKTINYKLRDWLFSRQRYWGEPFPVLLDDEGRHEALSDADLPVLLPDLSDFKPTGTPEPPLAKAKEWRAVERGGRRYLREINTMPQWAGSCWYYLRYLDPSNDAAPFAPEKEKYWMPVDLYVGGAEHAVLHLLYSRFWHKLLFDLGHVSTAEPFKRLVNQGMILGEMEYVGFKVGGDWVSLADLAEDATAASGKARRKDRAPADLVKLADDQVTKVGSQWAIVENPAILVDARAFRMSKSRGNVVNPDDVVDHYGADALRLYEMFMGPLEATKPWSTKGVEGVWRFLNRVWRLIVDDASESPMLAGSVVDREMTRDELRAVHRTIAGVTEDIEAMRFNTAISKLMELVNFLNPLTERPKAALETLTLLVSPFAPHVGEELWEVLGHGETLAYEPWPTFDPALLEAETIEVALQINNKVRSKIAVAPSVADDDLIAQARKDERIAELLAGKEIVKEFVVSSRKGRLVNFVVKG